MRVLLKKSDAHRPLYLVTACHELRLFGVYEQLTDKIKSLSPTIGKLFEEVLGRFEHDHGKDFIRAIVTVLLCSRGGLLEIEMLELLKRKGTNEEALPQAIWSRTFSNIQSILRVTGEASQGTLDFFHKEVSKAVYKRYIELDQEQEVKAHKMLAEYYYQKADPGLNGTWEGDSLRAFSELPYHLVRVSSQ
jgi:telomerase protein component 1